MPQGARLPITVNSKAGYHRVPKALWQLLHASTLEEGVIDTVMRGDTDTNGAIAGALLGAVHGRKAIPAQWVDKLLNCRPAAGRPNLRHPRPECFWPVDALHIARCLVAGGELDEFETV
jgi:ADP-ribosyl-[dinitrogen reductase] hydrolase